MIPLLIAHSKPLLWTAGSAQVVLWFRMTVQQPQTPQCQLGFSEPARATKHDTTGHILK